MKTIFFHLVILIGLLDVVRAQLTYEGNQTIAGDLNVGVTGTTGSLTVTGDVGNAATPGLVVTGDGGVVFSGSVGVGSLPSIALGQGNRFVWFPKKGAVSIGNHYIGGENSFGQGTIRVGRNNEISGDFSSAFGDGSQVEGENSVSFNGSYASGYGSVAMSGGASIFMRDFATSMSGGVARNDYATAISRGSAKGEVSVAMAGGFTEGLYSISAGYGAKAIAMNSVSFGRNNVAIGDPLNWVESDPLFVIGNGTGIASDPPEVRNRNAITVYKDGSLEVSGDVRFKKRQGDILMGEFGN